MKRNQKPNHCKNCTAMQNTKKGQERYCKWLRGKSKEKSTNRCKVQCDAQARTGTKRFSAKTGQG